MKHDDRLEEKKRSILNRLSKLPRKILQFHGRENTAEFILHELGRNDCFNLERAAYIIDNPDFDCTKGVAGYCRQEEYNTDKDIDIWDDADNFSKHMQSCPYNMQVRSFTKPSYFKQGKSEEDIVKTIAQDLGFDHPSYYAWPMKHDNHGILLYQKHEQDECDCDYLLDGLCLIGFCPVF